MSLESCTLSHGQYCDCRGVQQCFFGGHCAFTPQMLKWLHLLQCFFFLVLCALKARGTSLYIHHLIWVHAYSYLDAVFENRLKIIYIFELKHIAVPTGRFQIIVSCKCLDMMFKRMPRIKVVQDSYVKVQHCICYIKRIDSSKLFASYF